MSNTANEFGEKALGEIQQALMFYAKPDNWKDKKVAMDGGMKAVKTLITFLEWVNVANDDEGDTDGKEKD